MKTHKWLIGKSIAIAIAFYFCISILVIGKVSAQGSIVGRWPYGHCYSVDASGDYAYVASGSSVVIYDISTLSSPVKVGEIVLKALINSLRYHDHRLYICTQEDFYVVDITTISSPEIVFDIPSYYELGSVDFQDTLLAVADYGSITIYSIADPARLPELGSVTAFANYVVFGGNKVYASTYQGFDIFDISDLENITQIATVDSMDQCNEIACNGNYVYLTEFKGLGVFDISDPENITQSAFKSVHQTYLSGLYFDGPNNRLFCTSYSKTTLFDVSDPSSPSPIDSLEFDGEMNDLELDSTTLYVGCGSSVYLLDVSDPASPVIYDTLDFYWPNAYDIERKADYLLTTGWTNDFRYADIDPLNNTVAETEPVHGYTNCTKITDDYIFLGFFYIGLSILARDSIIVPEADTLNNTDTLETGGENPETISLTHNSMKPDFIISPNPSHGRVQIIPTYEVAENNSGIRVSIYNLSGQLLQNELFRTYKPFVIDASHLKKGEYIIKISAANRNYTKKITLL
jgi:hypothetical protein